tara:strand:+ start:35 stop:634 length:600 start_codon:yes stop_codon:yes gene_type:complete
MNNYKVNVLFPSCIHEYVYEKFDEKELVNFCYKQKEKHPDGLFNSNRGGWHSPFYNLKNDENIISKTLFKGLGKSIFTSIKPNLGVNVQYWIMINSPNSYNTSHTHPDAHLSGVMWIKSNINSGDLLVNNPFDFTGYVECHSYIEDFRDKTGFYPTYRFNPIAGKMLTFPSSLRHEVTVNESNEDRIAVSFNVRIFDPN